MSLVSATTGCDPLDPSELGELDEIELRQLENNGMQLNGFRLNGFRLNGFRLNGAGLVGENGGSISLWRVRLPSGSTALMSWLGHGNLFALSPQLTVLWGTQLVNAQLDFTVDDGLGNISEMTAKVVAVAPLASDSDVLRYDLQVKTGGGPWLPMCADALGNQVGAVLLADVWSPTTGDRVYPAPSSAATVACLNAALGKCVAWGYVPWKSIGGTSLHDYHQACTRAVRADYCGDGLAHTSDGTQIHVLDQIGVETEAPGSTYVIEAEWDADGATCFNPSNTRLSNQTIECALPTCGASFGSGGLIQTGKLVI